MGSLASPCASHAIKLFLLALPASSRQACYFATSPLPIYTTLSSRSLGLILCSRRDLPALFYFPLQNPMLCKIPYVKSPRNNPPPLRRLHRVHRVRTHVQAAAGAPYCLRVMGPTTKFSLPKHQSLSPACFCACLQVVVGVALAIGAKLFSPQGLASENFIVSHSITAFPNCAHPMRSRCAPDALPMRSRCAADALPMRSRCEGCDGVPSSRPQP